MVSAFAGHAEVQAPQTIHCSGEYSGFPLKPSGSSNGLKGYFVVASPVLIMVLNNFNIVQSLT